jgi:hypothetical protein
MNDTVYAKCPNLAPYVHIAVSAIKEPVYHPIAIVLKFTLRFRT